MEREPMTGAGIMIEPRRDPAVQKRVLRGVGLIAAHGVSGVSSATARLGELAGPHHPWRIMAIGPGAERPGLPGSHLPGFLGVPWDERTPPVEQARLVRAALRECGADVVNPNFLFAGFAGAALDHHRGRRIGAIWHGSEASADEVYSRAAPLADAWRAVSPAIAARVGSLLGAKPSGVLGAGIHVPDVVAPPPFCLGRGRSLRLLYAAWLDNRSKRVMDLVALADGLAARGVEFRLTIAGRGPAESALRRELAPHGDRVTLAGPVPLDQMARAHREHDALVLVSANEGSPVVVMEAMAQGRPVAITRGCGGALLAVRDGIEGFVVDVGDMDAMAAKLASLAGDSTRLARMSVSAHQSAKSCFDLEAVAGRYDELLEEAAGAPSHPEGTLAAQWLRIRAALEMIGPSRPAELAGLCAEWLADMGHDNVWLHWTLDAPELLEAINRYAPGLVRGLADLEPAPSRLGWPVLPLASVPRGAAVLTSEPVLAGAATQAELLATIDPHAPTLVSRLFLRSAERLREQGCSSLALYGAGKHTRRLGRWIAQIPEIVAVLDDRAGEPGGPPAFLWGLPVVKPDSLGTFGIDGVIVSSDEFEHVMLPRARAWRGPKVVGVYDEPR
jgi:glycosyltransferase involved in cell wall biosynthesis